MLVGLNSLACMKLSLFLPGWPLWETFNPEPHEQDSKRGVEQIRVLHPGVSGYTGLWYGCCAFKL